MRVGMLVAGALQLTSVAFGQPVSGVSSLTRELQSDLASLAHAAESARDPVAESAGRRQLTALLERLRATDLLMRERHEALEARLTGARLPAAVLQRHRDAVRAYRERLDRILRAAETVEGAGASPARLRQAFADLAAALDAGDGDDDRIPIGVTLPYRSLAPPQVAPQPATPIVPAYLAPAPTPPIGADLAGRLETELTPEIRARAAALRRDPIAIFEFVQNGIRSEFYHGAMKSAGETLRQGSGNDVDQASLLIALLRAAGIAARYVRGVAALSGPQAIAWTGTGSTRRAAEVLTRAGIPFRPIREGATIGSFEVERTWVEAYVPYANYRGVRLGSIGQAWIPLDPSFKAVDVAAGQDLLAAIGFRADTLVNEYLALANPIPAADFFRAAITDYLAAERPDLTFEQVTASVSIRTVASGLLPSTLPYSTTSITEEFAELPDRLRHRVRFIAEGEGGRSFDVVLSAAAVSGRRITISYVPATVDDQAAVHAFLGLSQTPAYLVKLRPVLKVGGIVIAAGATPVQMGALHAFTMELQTPRGSFPIANRVVAGGYYAIALGTDLTAHAIPAARAADDTEQIAADRLYAIAADYVRRWNAADRLLASILRIVPVRPVMSEVMVGTAFARTTLFGQPEAIAWRGVYVDADLRAADAVPMGTDDSRSQEFVRLSGLAGSALEDEVLQANLQAKAVSATRVIQLARAAGVAIEEVDASNLAAVLARLQTAGVVRSDVEDAVSQGWRVTIPRTDIVRHVWTGIGYIVRDPATGAGGYFISGGHAGGSTTQSPEDWANEALAEELGAPYDGEPNTNPTDAFSIQKVSITDHQEGTVGEPLERPLAVWVRDREGRPVRGAEVTFTVQRGGGRFGSLESNTAVTNYLGIAQIALTLGQSTAELPSFVRQSPADQHLTQVGQNIVMARVNGSAGIVSLEAPFQHFAYPGPVVRLVKALGDNAEAPPGTAGGSLLARAEDEYGNPVSNVAVEFAVQAPVLTGPGGPIPPPPGTINLAIYPHEPPCPIVTPLIGDCNGVAQVTAPTSTAGAAVNSILGNTVGTTYSVTARVAANAQVPVETFTLRSLLVRAESGWRVPQLWLSRVELVSGRGTPLNSAMAGATLTRPLEALLYVIEDDYVFEPIPGAQPECLNPPPPGEPPRPCFRVRTLLTSRIRPVDNNGTGTVTYQGVGNASISVSRSQEAAAVAFTPMAGGGQATTAVNAPPGRYASVLTLGPLPAVNQIEVTALATVWTPCFNLRDGIVGARLLQLRAFQHLSNTTLSCDGQAAAGGTAGSVSHTVTGARATVPDTAVRVIENGTTAETREISYLIEPAVYVAASADVDLFTTATNGEDFWLGYLPGRSLSGAGQATLLQGVALDPNRPQRLQVVLNRGTDVEIRSEKAQLRLIPPALLSTSGTRVTTYLDRVNQQVCVAPASFPIFLARDAVVTITVDGFPFTDANGVLYQNRPMPAGARDPVTRALQPHTIPVTPAQVSAPGDHPLVVTAVFDEPDQLPDITTAVTDTIVHDVVINAVLPVGHTVIKGVDLFDGHFSLTREDLSIRSHGPPLHFVRSYSTAGQNSTGVMGAGWGHNYDAKIVRDQCGVVTLIGGEGSGIRFTETSPGVFRPQAGYHGRLTFTAADGSYDFYTNQRVRYRYEPTINPTAVNVHRLAFVEDSNGNRLTLTYDQAPPFLLRTIADASGRTLTLTHELVGMATRPPEYRLVRIDGPLALRVTYAYDGFGNLVSATRAQRIERYAYATGNTQDRHNLIRIVGPNNGVTGADADVTELTYFSDQDPIPGESPNTLLFPQKWELVRSVTAGAGTPEAAAHQFTYDYSNPAQRRTRVTDPRAVETVYTMHPNFGAVLETRVVAPGGDNVTTTRWAFQDGIDDVVITAATDANGRRTSYQYDANGNPTVQTIQVDTGPYAPVTTAAGSAVNQVVTRSEYHPALGRVTRQVDAEGRITDYQIDPTTGDVLSTTTYPGGSQAPVTTTYTYRQSGALRGLLDTMVDPLGRVTRYESYDAFGNPTRVVDPVGVVTIYEYDDRSRTRRIRDTRGHETLFEYDDLDRNTVVRKLTGAQPSDITMASAPEQTTSTAFLPGGQPQSVTNGNGHTTTYAYDALNRQIRQVDVVEDALGTSSTLLLRTGWDGNGNKTQEIDRNGVTHEHTYDALNRLTQSRVNGQVVVTVTHDAVGNRLSETDLHGHVTRFDLDRLYRVVQSRLALAPYVTRTRYDLVGNVLETTDANGNRTLNTYDGLDRLTSTTDALGFSKRIEYDAAGNRLLEDDGASGLRVRYEGHDGADRPARMRQEFTDPLTGQAVVYTTAYQYLDIENTTLTTDPRGTVWRERHNGQDAVIERIADAGGLALRTTYRYDGNGNLTAEKDAEGNVVDTAYAYDGLNRRISAAYPLGGTERWFYDGNGNVVRSVDRRGIVRTAGYDHLNRKVGERLVESISNGGAELTTITVAYDDPGNSTTVTDALGGVTQSFEDALHRPVRVRDALGQESRYEWDGVNRTAIVDKRNRRTEFGYDATNRLVETRRLTDAGPVVTATSYLDAQRQRIETEPNGVVTVVQLDSLQRERRTSRRHPGLAAPYGAVEIVLEEQEFDGVGNVVRRVDANGNVTRLEYDGVNRQTQVIEGFGSAVQAATAMTYDKAGNLLTTKDARVTGAAFDTRFTYDVRNRRVLTEDGAGGVTAYTYDQDDRIASITEPLRGSHVTTYAYDEQGKLLQVDDTRGGAGGITRYRYDGNRNLVAQQDAAGNLTTWRYDALNRQTDSFQHTVAGALGAAPRRGESFGGDEASAQRWRYAYDETDNQTLIVDAEGQRVVKEYDQLNRLALKTYQNHRPAPGGGTVFPQLMSVRYVYDLKGNVRRVEESKELQSGPVTEVTVMDYDPLDRLVLKTNPDGMTLRFEYDRAGNQTALVDADGARTTRAFDARQRVAAVTAAGSTTTFTYWPDSLQRTVSYPNGVVAEMTYDAADRVTQILNHAGQPTAPISQFDYTYDLNGNRLTQVERHARLRGGAAQSTTYRYDALNRLIGADYPGAAGMTYAYAPNGNRLSESGVEPATDSAAARTFAYNRVNQLLSITNTADPTQSVVLQYDRNGNTIGQRIGVLDGSGDIPAPSVVKTYAWDIRDYLARADRGAEQVGFDYDYAGRRTKMNAPAAQIRYLHDDARVVQEYDGASGISTLRYHHGPAGLLSLDGGGTGRWFYLRDGLGSTSEMVDPAGATQASYSYDAWGTVVASFDNTPNRRRFAGHYTDPETGLQFFGARYYDQTIGRFLSQDTFLGASDNPATQHRYLFALANPLRYVDPTGYASEEAKDAFDAGNPCHGVTGPCNPATKEVDDYVEAVNERYLARARAEGQALADMVGQPGGADPATGKPRPPTGMYRTRADIYAKFAQWQKEEQAFQTSQRERVLKRLEQDGDTLATRLNLFLEEAVENDPSLPAVLMATFVASTRELIPGMAGGELIRKLQIGHPTTFWDWVGGAGDALTFVAPVARATGGVRQTLQALKPTVAATAADLAAIRQATSENNIRIAVRATDVITANVTRVLTWMKVPAKPEKVKAKSLYGVAFGAVGPKANSSATGIARVWEFLGIMRSDLDMGWARKVTAPGALIDPEHVDLLDNADTLSLGRKLDEVSGTASYQHGSHATVGPRGGGPMGWTDMYNAGDIGDVIEFGPNGTQTVFSAAQARRFLLERGRYSSTWYAAQKKSTLISPYPALYVKGARSAGEHMAGKDRRDK